MGRQIIASIIVGGILGCGEPNAAMPASWEGQVDTLAGAHVLVRNTGRGIWVEGAGWRVRAEVRIGSRDLVGPQNFGDIRSFTVDDRGRIWALDGHASALRVFDRTGKYVRTIGRAGSGPGEFREPVHIDIAPGNQIWVMDPGNSRIVVFDTVGRHIRDIRATAL